MATIGPCEERPISPVFSYQSSSKTGDPGSVCSSVFILERSVWYQVFHIFSYTYFFLQWAEFIFFSCLMLVVCLIFSIMGYYYVPLKLGDVQGSADKQTPQIQGNMINLETKKTKF